MDFPSKAIENAVNELSAFPGIGKKSALRMVIHLIKRPTHEVESLAKAITALKTEVRFCKICGNISDSDNCHICLSPARNKEIVCVVEDFKDVLAIENTAQYNGLYHILGGLISPIDGIGPEQLSINALMERVQQDGIKEVIIALSANMEGDTTSFYISRKVNAIGVTVSAISRGISVGSEIEFADEITLGRSILNRVKYDL